MKGSSIRCPYCNHHLNNVTRTMRITVQGITHVRRYRKCKNPGCSMSFRTKEEIDESADDKNLVKTDEDRLLDNGKLDNG